MDLINSKKEKGNPMPCQCEICGRCGATSKAERDLVNAKNNKCFVSRFSYQEKFYKPFTNSIKTIELTCGGFIHLRTLKIRGAR